MLFFYELLQRSLEVARQLEREWELVKPKDEDDDDDEEEEE